MPASGLHTVSDDQERFTELLGGDVGWLNEAIDDLVVFLYVGSERRSGADAHRHERSAPTGALEDVALLGRSQAVDAGVVHLFAGEARGRQKPVVRRLRKLPFTDGDEDLDEHSSSLRVGGDTNLFTQCLVATSFVAVIGALPTSLRIEEAADGVANGSDHAAAHTDTHHEYRNPGGQPPEREHYCARKPGHFLPFYLLVEVLKSDCSSQYTVPLFLYFYTLLVYVGKDAPFRRHYDSSV